MVPRDLHLTLQPQTQTIRSSLQRALQDRLFGWQRQWLPEECVRLRACEPGARQIALGQAAAFGLPLEQLWASLPSPLSMRWREGAKAGNGALGHNRSSIVNPA